MEWIDDLGTPRHEISVSVKAYRMRKLLSILLLLAFALPMASPAFALAGKDESQLPMCCRRGGKHHCAGIMAATAVQQKAPQLSAPQERCPYCPAAVAGVLDRTVFAPPVEQAIYAGVLAHPAGVAQTESYLRIARERARGKRGPPALA